MAVDDTVTVAITAGAPFYQISDFWVGELELVSDPDGPHGPLRFWDETRVEESDGGAALSPTARQRLHVEIGVGVPKSVLPAGAVNGEVSIAGAHFSLTIPLSGTYTPTAIAAWPRSRPGSWARSSPPPRRRRKRQRRS